jgi:hypothetical protein
MQQRKSRKKLNRVSGTPMSVWSYDDTAAESTSAHNAACDGYGAMCQTLWHVAGKM